MHAIKLPFKFDASKLLAEYQQIPKDAYHVVTNQYVTYDRLLSTHLIEIKPEETREHYFTPTPELLKLPYLLEVYETFKCDKETFRVHKLLSNAEIKKHRDVGLNYENGSLRIHIPIITNPEIEMLVEGENIKMLPGEVWYLDFDLPHQVSNPSAEDRVHLINDCLSNEWWDDIMRSYNKDRTTKQKRMSIEEITAMKIQLEMMDSDAAREILKTLE